MKILFVRWLVHLSTVAVLTWSALAVSQDESLDSSMLLDEEALLFQDIPSVYGASKYEQKVTEAPSSVSIVTSDEIRKYGYRTLSDILRSLRSFVITNDRNYNYTAVRGFGQPGDYNTRRTSNQRPSRPGNWSWNSPSVSTGVGWPGCSTTMWTT